VLMKVLIVHRSTLMRVQIAALLAKHVHVVPYECMNLTQTSELHDSSPGTDCPMPVGAV
jgi:hypothetical protein